MATRQESAAAAAAIRELAERLEQKETELHRARLDLVTARDTYETDVRSIFLTPSAWAVPATKI